MRNLIGSFCIALLTATHGISLDTWDVYNARYEVSQSQILSSDVYALVEPFLMTEEHPLKVKLDKLFAGSRAISCRKTLVAAGFEDKEPEPVTKIIVTRHRKMKGYIFKVYTDDYLDYHHGEPEVYTFLRRARGAKMIREEIALQGWDSVFKAPQKWIYAIPESSMPLKSNHVHRKFILVEEEMDLLSSEQIKECWRNGTMTKNHLDKLFYLTTRLGLRGCCKYDNIPICKDGRIAFVDTQSNLRWPVAYSRLNGVLQGAMLTYWQKITKDSEGSSVERIINNPN